MTDLEIAQGRLEAAQVLNECRKYGALVLREPDGNKWRLSMRVYNEAVVPTRLKFRLLELEPFVLCLLKELAR